MRAGKPALRGAHTSLADSRCVCHPSEGTVTFSRACVSNRVITIHREKAEYPRANGSRGNPTSQMWAHRLLAGATKEKSRRICHASLRFYADCVRAFRSGFIPFPLPYSVSAAPSSGLLRIPILLGGQYRNTARPMMLPNGHGPHTWLSREFRRLSPSR